MYSYADVILFLLSPECRRKQKWSRLCPWDIFVLIHLVEKKELEHLLDKYKIVRLQAEDDVREVLLRNCVNMLCYSESRIARRSAEGHLASKRMENCMLLMNLFDWDKDRAALLIDKMFCYLSKSVLLEGDARTFTISSNLLYSFLVKQYENGYRELVSPHAEALLKRLLGKFLKEDHLNRYSQVLEDNVEWYCDTGTLSNLIDKEHNGISGKLIAQCWKCYRKWYRGVASRLLADIYPFASSRVQKEISQFACRKIKGMSMILLRSYMEKDIISYSSEVETELLDRCRRFLGLPDKQRKRIPGGSDEKPLTHILRLWQNGKIPDIKVFREFKGIDSWFSFVCFPKEFDYKNFNVEGWCTWLSVERYRKEAFQMNHKLLKDKFRQVIDEGTENEDVRRIYYKYLE